MRLNNKIVVDKMCKLIRENLSFNDFKKYIKTFYKEYDFNIFQYGCLDIYDYDLYKRLDEFGVTTKAVTEYAKVLDFGCTYKHRENIRQAYKTLVRRAAQQLNFQIRLGELNEDDFIK
jgi:hypothetical protein